MAWKDWLRVLIAENIDAQHSAPEELPQTLPIAWRFARRATHMTDEALSEAAAQLLGVKRADLNSLDPTVIRYIPERTAMTLLALPVGLADNGNLIVAAAEPTNEATASQIRFGAGGRPVELRFASPDRIEDLVLLSYSQAAQREAGQVAVLEEGVDVAGRVTDPVIRLSNLLLDKAVKLGASDIHIQPHFGGGRVRMRVDGLLRREMVLPRLVSEHVIRHFMAISDMNSTELNLPQDGRSEAFISGARYDLRLSMLPARGGPALVIRLLNQSRNFSLQNLGFSVDDRNTLFRLIGKMSGVLLVTGPTGSGKTTTLYALLAGLNRPEVRVASVEDPVEYEMHGVTQTEVDERRGLTFDKAVRSLMRQDPDVMLIGEIRDEASAAAATRAALTGHFLMSTLHTTSARGALTRLLDLGVSRSMMAEIILGVVAQRLLRRLCSHCASPVTEPLELSERRMLDLTDDRPAMRAVGCSHCGHTGYRGRLPIAEIYEPTAQDRAALMSGHDVAVEPTPDPMTLNLARRAYQLVLSGMTTVDEAERILGSDFWSGLARMRGREANVVLLQNGLFGETDDARATVLLVSPVPDYAHALRQMLEQAGYGVVLANSADVANQILSQGQDVNALLIDVHGDDERGLQVLLQARQTLAWTGLPALILLPSENTVLRAAVEERLPNRTLNKPAHASALINQLQGLLH